MPGNSSKKSVVRRRSVHEESSEAPNLLKVGDAAKRLAVSRKHVYRLIDLGSLVAVDVSASADAERRSVRIHTSAIDRFIRGNSTRRSA